MKIRNTVLKAHPATLVLASFLLVILAGTALLLLPVSTAEGKTTHIIDALFTATSAVCVTGLTVVDTGTHFSRFGQWMIMLLIQVGGLGLMTISVALFQWLGRGVSIRHRMAMQDIFTHTPRQDIFNLVRSVIFFTLGVEFVGAVFLTISFLAEFPWLQAGYLGLFHAVSAFCNAGFGLFPDNLMRYSGHWTINLTVCGLIVIGGIGFPVLYDLRQYVSNRRIKRVRLTIQTKTVLITTLILILGGAVMFAILERGALSGAPALSHRLLIPLFQSITCRTAGFNTVDIGALGEATLLVMIFLMFFGASPGSCGGGVKTTTIALVSVFTISRIRRRRRVNLFKKSVPTETVSRSLSLILISIGIISTVLFLMLAEPPSEPKPRALPYLFETVSAFGTVGLSVGITSSLSFLGKFWIILTMIIGRVGVLTFAYIIVGGEPTRGIEHSEENLMIG